MFVMNMSLVATTGVAMSLTTAERRCLHDSLVTVMVMGAAVDEPEVGRPRKDHGQNRHKTEETEAQTLRNSVSWWPEWRFHGHLRHSSQGEEQLIHIHGHDH